MHVGEMTLPILRWVSALSTVQFVLQKCGSIEVCIVGSEKVGRQCSTDCRRGGFPVKCFDLVDSGTDFSGACGDEGGDGSAVLLRRITESLPAGMRPAKSCDGDGDGGIGDRNLCPSRLGQAGDFISYA